MSRPTRDSEAATVRLDHADAYGAPARRLWAAAMRVFPLARVDAPRALRVLLLAGLVVLVALPLALLPVASVADQWFFPALGPETWDLGAWRRMVTRHGLLRATATSTALGVIAAAAGTAVALPTGRMLARLDGWPRHLLTAAVFLPVAAPPIALATGLHTVFLRAGLAGTFGGVVLAHMVPVTGYLGLFFLGVFLVHDDRAAAEARTLGGSPWQVLAHVTLPALRVPLVTALVLGFLISWAQLPLTLVIGAGLVSTLPIEVFAFMNAGDDRLAAAAGVLLAVPPLVAVGAGWAAQRVDATAV